MEERVAPDASEGLDAARAALGKALSGQPTPSPEGGTPTPTPEPAPAPASQPGVAPEPAPVPGVPAAPPAAPPAATPVPPAPTPTPTPVPGEGGAPAPQPGVEFADPMARRYVEMHGGNVEAALAKALADNNRLGQLGRAHPELFQEGAPGDPHQQLPDDPSLFGEPPLEAPPEELPGFVEPELDPTVIQGEVNNRIRLDPTSQSLYANWAGNTRTLGDPEQNVPGLLTEIKELEGQVQYLTRKAADPDLAPDDLRKADIRSELQSVQMSLGLKQQEAFRLQTENQNLDFQWRQRRAELQGVVEDEYGQYMENQAITQYQQQVEVDEEQRFSIEWPTALRRVISENHIPTELQADFVAEAERAFYAAMADDSVHIENAYAFLAPVGKQILERQDRYHRIQSGQYAQAAHQRAAAPGAPPGPPGAPQPTPAQERTPEEGIAEAAALWKQATNG